MMCIRRLIMSLLLMSGFIGLTAQDIEVSTLSDSYVMLRVSSDAHYVLLPVE